MQRDVPEGGEGQGGEVGLGTQAPWGPGTHQVHPGTPEAWPCLRASGLQTASRPQTAAAAAAAAAGPEPGGTQPRPAGSACLPQAVGFLTAALGGAA